MTLCMYIGLSNRAHLGADRVTMKKGSIRTP